MGLDLGTASGKLQLDAAKWVKGLKESLTAAKQFEAASKALGNNVKAMGVDIDAGGKSLSRIKKEGALAASELEKAGKKAKGPFKEVGLAIAQTENKLKTANATIDHYKESISKTSAELQKNKQVYVQNAQQISDYKSRLEEAKTQYGENSAEAQKYTQKIEELGKTQTELAGDINKAEESLIEMQTELNKTEMEADKLSDSLKKMPFEMIGGKFKAAGAALSATVTPALIGTGTAAAKMAMDTEQSLTKVNSILQLGGKEFSTYSASIKQGARETGIAYKEYADAAYDAVSAGVKQSDVNAFLAQSNKLAVAGLTDQAKATDVLTTIQNAYNMSQKDMAHVSDVLIKTQNLGKVTVDELASSMGDLIPAAKSAGVSVEQLGASYAILTASGIKAAPASTMMKSLFSELSETGSQTDKILRQIAGGSFTELMQQGKSVGDVLQILSEHAKKSNLTLKDLFGSSEAGDAALALMKDGADGFNQSLAEMVDSAGTCDKAFEMLNNTTEKKVGRAFAALKNLLADVGTAIAPLVGKIAELGEKMATAMSNFVNAHPTITSVVVALGGLAAVTGPVLLALGLVVSKIPDLVKGFNDIKKGASLIKGFFSTASLAANGPLLAIGAVTLGVVGLAKAYKDNEEQIKQSFDQWCEDVDTKAAETWNSVKESVLEFGQAAADGLANGMEAIIGIFTTTGEFISQLFSAIWTGLTTSVSTVFTTIGTVFSTGWEFVKTTTATAWENIKTTVSNAWANITTDISTKITNIKTTVFNAWNNIKANTLNAWNNVKTSISNAVTNAKTTVTNGWNSIKTNTTNAWNNIKTAISNAWTNIKTACSNAVNNVKTSVTNGFNQLKSITQNAWNNVVSAIRTAWTNIKSAVQSGAQAVVSACRSAFSNVKEILTAPFRAAQSAISGILGGIKSKIASIANFGKGRAMQAMEMAMPYRISTYAEAVQDNTPMLFARGGGIVGTLEDVKKGVNALFPNNWSDLVKNFGKTGQKAGEAFSEAFTESITKKLSSYTKEFKEEGKKTGKEYSKGVEEGANKEPITMSEIIENLKKQSIEAVKKYAKAIFDALMKDTDSSLKKLVEKFKEEGHRAGTAYVKAIEEAANDRTIRVKIESLIEQEEGKNKNTNEKKNLDELKNIMNETREQIARTTKNIRDNINTMTREVAVKVLQMHEDIRKKFINTYNIVSSNMKKTRDTVVKYWEEMQQALTGEVKDVGTETGEAYSKGVEEGLNKTPIKWTDFVEQMNKQSEKNKVTEVDFQKVSDTSVKVKTTFESLVNNVNTNITKMTSTTVTKVADMCKVVMSNFAKMSSEIINYMSRTCASTISYWNQMRATLGQTIRGEIVVTHRDIYIEERQTSGGGGANSGKKMLARMFSIPQTDTMQTLALLNTDAAAIRFRDMQGGGSSNTRSRKGDIIDYDKLGKTIAKYQKGDVKIENTYNSPKPASIKELKQQDEILLRRLKKQKRI